MPSPRQRPREFEMLRLLAQAKVDVSPLRLMSVELHPGRRGQRTECGPDADLVLRWQRKTYRFLVECKAGSTPKEVAQAAEMATRSAKPPRSYPLVFAPYLSDSQFRSLLERDVSGVDLCGNALITVPGEVLVYRSGAPNRFPSSGIIKNIYRKNSSIVVRAFLLVPTYDSISELMHEIKARGAVITQATASKVSSSLDQDLIVERTRGPAPRTKRLRLIQPGKLLDLLAENYERPLIRQRTSAKSSVSPEELRGRLAEWGRNAKEKIALTGSSSATQYVVMAREPIQSFYCSNLQSLLKSLGRKIEETSRFPDMELLEVEDGFVYFDVRDGLASSPIQAYLELMQGDKREREAAEQLRKAILEPLQKQG